VKEQEVPLLPTRFFRLFLDVLYAELGSETMVLILEKANLPVDLIDSQAVARYNGGTAAEAYARIQQAMRIYYGRGARGTLTRIGRLLWPRLLEAASIYEKTQAQIVRTLPPSLRMKPAIELLARFLRERNDGVTVHTMDLDLLMVDHAAPVAIGQAESHSICYVTLGLLQEATFWASGREHDVDELSCKANGGDNCEFKIVVGSK
jgi:predicted hydrocarbon binding protein